MVYVLSRLPPGTTEEYTSTTASVGSMERSSNLAFSVYAYQNRPRIIYKENSLLRHGTLYAISL